MESSTWGEPAGPPVSVDNGTSAWGKPVDTASSWQQPGRENSGGSGWGNAAVGQQSQHKSGMAHVLKALIIYCLRFNGICRYRIVTEENLLIAILLLNGNRLHAVKWI